MAGWTQFLPEAQKWVAGQGFHPLYGHPGRKKKARKIRLHKVHVKNHLISAAKHPAAAKPVKNPFRRSTGYIVK